MQYVGFIYLFFSCSILCEERENKENGNTVIIKTKIFTSFLEISEPAHSLLGKIVQRP